MTEMKEESWWKDTEWVPIANKPFSFFEGGGKKKKKEKERLKILGFVACWLMLKRTQASSKRPPLCSIILIEKLCCYLLE